MLTLPQRLNAFVPPTILKKSLHLLLKADQYMPLAIKKPVILPLLQKVLKTAIEDGDMDFLNNKIIKILLTDTGSELYLSFNNRHLELHKPISANVCISGKMEEFIYLAARHEDPDTLFFQRRLMIEGDTELGLEFKNIMDAIDYDTLPAPFQKGIQLLADNIARL